MTRVGDGVFTTECFDKDHARENKNFDVVRNAECARSRCTLKLSHIFLINDLMNELIN